MDKIWYVYSPKKGKFIRISQEDLEENDICCCKKDGSFVIEDTSTVFVVTKATKEEDPMMHAELTEFKIESLVRLLGFIAAVHDEAGVYLLPSACEKYQYDNGEFDFDKVDADYGILKFSGGDDWYNHASENIKKILQKNCSG